MPNHIHLIIMIGTSGHGSPGAAAPTVSLPQIVNALKSLATREAGKPLWQRGYYEHIIRNGQDHRDI